MSNGSSLTKKSIVYGIGNIGTLAINFFLIPLYTFYLTEEDLGLFDLLASTLVIASPLFFANIELSVLRWILANKETLLIKKVLSNAIVIIAVGLSVFSLLFYVIGQFFEITFFNLIYLYFVSNFIYILFKQILRAVYSSWHYVLTELVYVSIILGCFLSFGAEYQLKAIFISYGIASLSLVVYLHFLGFYRNIDFGLVNLKFSGELIRYSFPLSLNAISLWLNNQSNKYIIAMYLTLAANGIYAVAFKFAYVIQILNRIFYMSFQDKMYSIYHKKPERYFSDTLKKYTAILFSFLYMLTGFKDLVIPYIIDKKFLHSLTYMPILGLGVLFFSLGSVLGIIYQCEKKNLNAFKTSLVSGLIIMVMGYFFIAPHGLIGASLIFVIGNFIFLIYRFIDIQKYMRVNGFFVHFSSYTLIFFLLLTITLIDINGNFHLAGGFAIISSYIINRNVLNTFFRNTLNRLKNSL